MRLLLGFAVLAAAPGIVGAQTPDEPPTAAITPQAIARHIGVLADDSMLGRATPSPQLVKTAKYVSEQFEQLGLKRGSESGWTQDYWIFPRVDFARSQVTFTAGGKTAAASFATTARLLAPSAPARSAPAGVVFIAGRHTPATVAQVDVKDKIVLYAPEISANAKIQKAVEERLRSTSTGLVALSALDSAGFARRVTFAQRRSGVRPDPQWAVSIAPEQVPGLAQVLASVGIDLARVRQDSTPVSREIPALQIAMHLQLDRSAGDSASVPNVIGVLEGSDTALASEYVVYIAHMDHTGITRGRPDSINNGANDNASGVAGLIELARAFSQPGARPARTVVFLATSGADGLLGSNAYINRYRSLYESIAAFSGSGFTISLGDFTPDSDDRISLVSRHAIAAVSLDRIGAAAGDSIIVDGIDDAHFASPPPWIAAAHPELRLTVINGGTAALPTSDHFPFLQNGVPSLYFHDGPAGHERADSADASDTAAAIDTDRAARILRLAFYVGTDIANAKRSPAWTADGRRAYLESAGQQ